MVSIFELREFRLEVSKIEMHIRILKRKLDKMIDKETMDRLNEEEQSKLGDFK